MTRKEFVEKLFGTEILSRFPEGVVKLGCQGFHCPLDTWCDTCKYAGFWNKEINLPYISKNVLNMLYGANTECNFVIAGRGAGRNHAIERSIELSGWQKFPRVLDMYDFETIRDIVDEALDNGFEFKVFNSTLYYREKGYANTDSTQDVD